MNQKTFAQGTSGKKKWYKRRKEKKKARLAKHFPPLINIVKRSGKGTEKGGTGSG